VDLKLNRICYSSTSDPKVSIKRKQNIQLAGETGEWKLDKIKKGSECE